MKKLPLLFILLMGFSLNQSFAQFEGSIQIDSYTYNASGQKEKGDDSFTLYITPDRMLLQGDNSYKVRGTLKTDGILVRQKEKDFVFLTGDKKAMKITKSGITSFMNMFGNDANDAAAQAESNIKVDKTGDSKKINGYSCQKFIITNKEHPEERSEVWMTDQLDINWGILAESWDDNLKGFAGEDLPLNLILQDGYFPIQWKQYEDGALKSSAEAIVTESPVARDKVEIPADVQVVSLQNYLFDQMRKQQ